MKEKNEILAAMRKLLPRDVTEYKPVDVYVHCSVGNSATGEARVSIVERNYNPGEQDIRHEFAIPCRVIWGWKGEARRCPDGYHEYRGSDKASSYRPCGGYVSLDRDHFASVIHSIPADARMCLVVGLDVETNSHMARMGLHGDAVSLLCETTQRGKTVKRSFRVGLHVGPHDSARFGSPGCGGAYMEHG